MRMESNPFLHDLGTFEAGGRSSENEPKSGATMQEVVRRLGEKNNALAEMLSGLSTEDQAALDHALNMNGKGWDLFIAIPESSASDATAAVHSWKQQRHEMEDQSAAKDIDRKFVDALEDL